MTAELSPLLRDLVPRIASTEARLAVVDGEIATLEAERATLRASIEAIQRALDPKQVALPLPGLGSPAPLREPTRAGAALLARVGADGQVIVKRTGANRGEIKAASSMATGERPLLELVGKDPKTIVYRVTTDGELRRRELAGPAAEGATGKEASGE